MKEETVTLIGQLLLLSGILGVVLSIWGTIVEIHRGKIWTHVVY